MSHIIQYQVASSADISGVLNLQSLYLATNLSDEEKKAGFVTTPFSVAQLEDIIAQEGLFVAKKNDLIIAYIFAGSWQYFSQWPIFNHITSLFSELAFQDFKISTVNSFQYGPICIHKDFRGQGLINPLFELMRVHLQIKYPLSLTFINQINLPSIKAHVDKLRWTIIGEFGFNNNRYFVLAYDMKKTALA